MALAFKRKRILVIGDAHVTNDQPLRRFSWLNYYLDFHTPDTLVIIGDFMTLNVLSAWDRDKRKLMEGRRYWKEVEAGNKALDLLSTALSKIRTKIFMEGNHEERLVRYLNVHPEFSDGNISIQDNLYLAKRGFQWVPYREYIVVGGLHFTHIPFGKAKEIAGKDICTKAEQVTTESVVFGHTHELHTSCIHKHGQEHLQQILNVGCFFEQEDEYIHGHITNYWKGVVELDNFDHGRFDLTTISMKQLQAGYKK